ncbi:alkaline phosphatase family protein, partial [Listeria monocytogenes]|nr:alkaline phosphatase family protein [Listeria monocytogenes]
NKITAWKVYAKSCDGSSYIYTKDDLHTQEIQHLLQRMAEIEKILPKEEIVLRGADADATFMVEGKAGYYFMDDLYGP